MKALREGDIVKACLEYLAICRAWTAWRNNTGALRDSTRRLVRYGKVGSADILAILPPTGRFLSVEVKRPGGRMTDSQKEWMQSVKDAGGIAVCVTSVSELVEELKREGY